MKVREITGVQ